MQNIPLFHPGMHIHGATTGLLLQAHSNTVAFRIEGIAHQGIGIAVGFVCPRHFHHHMGAGGKRRQGFRNRSQTEFADSGCHIGDRDDADFHKIVTHQLSSSGSAGRSAGSSALIWTPT